MKGTGQSSKTARLVARGLLLASRDRTLRRMLPVDATEIINSMPAVAGGGFGALSRFAIFRKLCKLIERIALPGIVAHYLVRKAWIEREVRLALASGIHRVVVIGAGFDTLAPRLSSEYPDVEFLELDHPATQKEKADSIRPRENLRLVAVDLERESPSDVLLRLGLAPKRSVVIAEGLTMYLGKGRVRALLSDAAGIAGHEGRVLFSFMERGEDGSIGFPEQSPWVKRWLDSCGESFQWGIEPSRLKSFLGGCGLNPSATAGTETLRTEILQPIGLGAIHLARGEWLCLAKPIRP